MNVGLIVEGHGEVFALPNLIRKIASDAEIYTNLVIPRPFRLARGKMLKRDEIVRAADLMSRKVGPEGLTLILLDADDDCPVVLARTLAGWIEEGGHCRVRVVLANREFEAWFLAGIESLAGMRGVSVHARLTDDPDTVRDAKGVFAASMTGTYSETVDQPAFAAILNTQLAERSRSFSKFKRVVTDFLNSH